MPHEPRETAFILERGDPPSMGESPRLQGSKMRPLVMTLVPYSFRLFIDFPPFDWGFLSRITTCAVEWRVIRGPYFLSTSWNPALRSRGGLEGAPCGLARLPGK